MERNKPVREHWDGNIKAAIFANQGQNGPVFNTTYSRIYTDAEGKTKAAYSFSGVENLRVAELARKAHNTTNELRKAYNERVAQARQAEPAQTETVAGEQQGEPQGQPQGEPITAEMFEPPGA